MSDIKIYTYKQCGTCKKATKYLDAKGVEYNEIAIREKPPTKTELKRMLKNYEGEIKRLFNTSGQDYRNNNYKEKLPNMTKDEAIAELAANGNLVKRPFVLIKDNQQMVGFKESEWYEVFQ